jgi:hypothetical protein
MKLMILKIAIGEKIFGISMILLAFRHRGEDLEQYKNVKKYLVGGFGLAGRVRDGRDNRV